MKFYEKILFDMRTEPQTLKTIFNHAFSFSDEVAFEWNHHLIIHKMTYAECLKEIERLSVFFTQKVPSGSIIALCMPNSPLWVECFWAVLMSGCRVMPLSNDMPDSLIGKCMRIAGCHYLLGNHQVEDCVLFDGDALGQVTREQALVNDAQPSWGDEIILTTSATTGDPKLYSYTGKELCAQILNSGYVLNNCRDISRFWKGQFRQLAFLPFSHIFGLTACYLWFAIFGRTFVFLENYAPSTILRTCRLHHVTHILSIPLLWDSLAEEIVKEAKRSNQYDRLMKGISVSLRIQDLSPTLGRLIVPFLMRQVRYKTLGESIRFCISGGGVLKKETARIVNGCGYHLENGYGMTEIGIASVTLWERASMRDAATVGRPFPSVLIKLDSNNHLLVRGESCFSAEYRNGERIERDTEAWFDTNDCFRICENGEMAILGRADDLVSMADGRRISPDMIESLLELPVRYCVVNLDGKGITLLVEVPSRAQLSVSKREAICAAVRDAMETLPVSLRPKQVLYTYETLPVSLSNKFKRRAIAEAVLNGKMKVKSPAEFLALETVNQPDSEASRFVMEITSMIKELLDVDGDVNPTDDFFADLGGDSLTYIEFLNAIERRYGIVIPETETGKCINALSVYAVISKTAES